MRVVDFDSGLTTLDELSAREVISGKRRYRKLCRQRRPRNPHHRSGTFPDFNNPPNPQLQTNLIFPISCEFINPKRSDGTWAMDLRDRRIRVNVVSPNSRRTTGPNHSSDKRRADGQRSNVKSNGASRVRPSTFAEVAKAVMSLVDETGRSVDRNFLWTAAKCT